jgi:hypothetical protein
VYKDVYKNEGLSRLFLPKLGTFAPFACHSPETTDAGLTRAPVARLAK